MPRPNVLVIAVDGLRASALGSYGNTWYRTPTLDRIAAQSVLCDCAFADSTDLALVYRGLWQSVTSMRPDAQSDLVLSLPKQLGEIGYHTRLVTDAQELTKFTAAEDFSEAVLLDNETVSDVSEVEQTCAAGVLGEVLEFIDDARSANRPWFLWTHLRGLYGTWDAPHELALSLVEEGDTPPEHSTHAPALDVERLAHIDTIFAETCRYAAQVMTLDLLLAPIIELVKSGAAGECLFVFLGTRGFPLGEHGRLGGVDGRLYSEQLHLPLLMRLPSGQFGLERISQLVLPCDLPTAILGALDASDCVAGDGLDFIELLREPSTPWRSLALASDTAHGLSIRTLAWYLRDLETSPELFVKPDDRWEANDIASRCPDVVAELTAIAHSESERLAAGEAISIARLPAALVEPPR